MRAELSSSAVAGGADEATGCTTAQAGRSGRLTVAAAGFPAAGMAAGSGAGSGWVSGPMRSRQLEVDAWACGCTLETTMRCSARVSAT